jgi:hypothetical protein
MKKIYFLFLLAPLLLNAQKNELIINYSNGLLFKGAVTRNSTDTINDFVTQAENSNMFFISYTRYIKASYYMRMSIGYEIFRIKVNNSIRSQYNELTNYRYDFGGINQLYVLSFGKQITYKFIDFQVGVDWSHTYVKKQDYSPVATYSSLNNELKYTIVTRIQKPSYYFMNVYLNTAIWFRIYKPFYFGLTMQNGFEVLVKNKGELLTTDKKYDNTGVQYYESIQSDYINQHHFKTDFLKISLGLRVKFNDIKSKKKV